MAKSKIQRLQTALERGEVEVAKKLAAEIAQAPPKAPRKPPRKTRPKTQESPGDASEGQPRPSRLILPGGVPPAPVKYSKDGEDTQSGQWEPPARTSSGRVAPRHVSMQGRQHINEFDKWEKSQERGFDGMDSRLKRANKVLTWPTTPRPGSLRPPARKVSVRCGGCGIQEEVYPSQMILLDSDSVYKCDRCSRMGK